MRKKPVLGCDLDDVGNLFNLDFLEYAREFHGVKTTYDDLKTYIYTIDYGITTEEEHSWIWDFCHNHHHRVRPLAGAQEALERLSEQFEIHMITSRCESIKEITLPWIDEHLGDVFSEFHFTNGFTSKFPERKRSKVSVCREIGAVAHIDDALHHIEDISSTLDILTIMPTRPWNKNVTPPGTLRVESWAEIENGLLAVA